MDLLPSITVDDLTVEPATGFGSELTQKIAELAQYRVSRLKAEQWAHKGVKFLVFDETDEGVDDGLVDSESEVDFVHDDEGKNQRNSEEHSRYGHKEYESDSSDALLARGTALSLENDGEVSDAEAGSAASSSLEIRKGKDPATDTAEEGCGSCQGFLNFPRHRKVRRFLIAKPPSTCTHFVCVSYCWPKDKDGTPIERPRTKAITMMDGTERPNRAPDDVLDRAVDVARCYGLRMIWIDQECLPQDESEEQQLGVQAMDILYAHASITAGLLSSATISTQAEMDAIHMMSSFRPTPSGVGCRWQGRGPAPVVNANICGQALLFLFKVASDPYYTRAWIVQESLSAGDEMCLVLPKAKEVSDPFGIDTCLASRIGSLAERAHIHRHQSVNVHIPVYVFKRILSATRLFIDPPFVRYGDALLATSDGGLPVSDPSETAHREAARKILVKAFSLHPEPPAAFHLAATLVAHGGGIHAPRQSCDTATALTLLKTRGCFRVEDRVAIVANMCGFDVRLNTFILAQKCTSLRLAIFAQAFLNADYTIFVPELYRTPRAQTHGLLSPFETIPHLIESRAIRGPGHINWSNWRNNLEMALFPNGLGIPAYLWNVDTIVDLTQIKDRHGHLWTSLHSLSAEVERKDGDSAEEFARRERMIAQRLSSREMMSTIKYLLYRSSQGLEIPMPLQLQDAYCEGGVLHLPGARVTSRVRADRVNGEKATKQALGEIIFDILRYLVEKNQSGLATSIWQSVRVDARDRDDLDLPDEAGDALFALLDASKDPWSFLGLSQSVDGSFNELWFVDRVMRDGQIWTGSYVRSRDPDLTTEVEETHCLSEEEEKDRALEEGKSILQRQLGRKLLAISMQSALINDDGTLDDSTMDRGSLIWYAVTVATGVWTVRAEDKRVSELVAAFDVDGPCVVATPFDSNWEMLPRPDVRSMSVCWVVEPVEDAESEKAEPEDTTRDVHFSDGMKAGEGTQQVRLSDESPKSHHSPGLSDKSDEPGGDEGPSSSEAGGRLGPDANFKVVDKVKGVWQIMDIPSQIYAFQ